MTTLRNVLVLGCDKVVVEQIKQNLPERRVRHMPDFAPDRLQKARCDLLFLHLDVLATVDLASAKSAFDTIMALLDSSAPVIVVAESSQMRQVFDAVKAGATSYLLIPIDAQEMRLVVETVEQEMLLVSEVEYLRERVGDTIPDYFRTNSGLMQNIFAQVKRVAPTRSTVLITGETGTGKTLLAKQIHQLSQRADGPFISVHCGAIPEALLESEFFGHERGAFTGAVRQKLGKFDIAQGGTVFLDEIGTIPAATQVKLLQVLQDRTFCRVGGEEELEADVRIVAATNDDLIQLCDEGLFRRDLYYRLNVFPLFLPPLRERFEDIELLARSFIHRICGEMGMSAKRLHNTVPEAFAAYDWPGNIRELENLLERACILEESDTLMPEDFPVSLFSAERRIVAMPSLTGTLQDVRQNAIEAIERRYLHELLLRSQGRISIAAEQAGVGTRQLHKLMTRYELRKEDYK